MRTRVPMHAVTPCNLRPALYSSVSEAHLNLISIQGKLNTWFLSHTSNISRVQYPQRLAATTLDSGERTFPSLREVLWEGTVCPRLSKNERDFGEHLFSELPLQRAQLSPEKGSHLNKVLWQVCGIQKAGPKFFGFVLVNLPIS